MQNQDPSADNGLSPTEVLKLASDLGYEKIALCYTITEGHLVNFEFRHLPDLARELAVTQNARDATDPEVFEDFEALKDGSYYAFINFSRLDELSEEKRKKIDHGFEGLQLRFRVS